MDRVSEPITANNTTYREIKKNLVCFQLTSLQITNNSNILIKVRFKDNFPPQQYPFTIGAQNKEGNNYLWNTIYYPFYRNELTRLNLTHTTDSIQIYSHTPSTNNKTQITHPITNKTTSQFLKEVPSGTIIATNTPLNIPTTNIPNYNNQGSLTINTQLRESHTFYTYIENEILNFTITKQDLNSYNGTDELEITIYAPNSTSITTVTIPDDGNINKTSKTGPEQKSQIKIPNLNKGVYKIDMKCSSDLHITQIQTDQNKLVAANRLFLITNDTIYFKKIKDKTIKFKTYHPDNLPNRISIKGSSSTQIVDIISEKNWFSITLLPCDQIYEIHPQYGDIIIESNNYFAFTNDSYFTPIKYIEKQLQNNMDWINNNNIDYIIIKDYIPVKEDDGWVIAQTSWDAKDLYIKDNTLNFVFNIPHLTKSEYSNYTIPVDWIDIIVTKPPIWKRI